MYKRKGGKVQPSQSLKKCDTYCEMQDEEIKVGTSDYKGSRDSREDSHDKKEVAPYYIGGCI